MVALILTSPPSLAAVTSLTDVRGMEGRGRASGAHPLARGQLHLRAPHAPHAGLRLVVGPGLEAGGGGVHEQRRPVRPQPALPRARQVRAGGRGLGAALDQSQPHGLARTPGHAATVRTPAYRAALLA
jgi:hypothetical protein